MPCHSAAAPAVRSGVPRPGQALLPHLAAPTSVPAPPSRVTLICASDRCPPTDRSSQEVSSLNCSGIKYLLHTKFSLNLDSLCLYICYCNIAWASTHQSKLQLILLSQKQTVRVISSSALRSHALPLLNLAFSTFI